MFEGALLVAPSIIESGETKMPNLGGWEWVIILVIVILVFGIGRIGKLGEEMGKGVRAFREGVKDGGGEDSTEEIASEDSE
jgi:sec-independent protein translocase protein TatA